MKKVCVILAEGFEEVEAVTVIDLLRRGEVDVAIVTIGKTQQVKGRSGIEISANYTYSDDIVTKYDGVVLPGGMPGTDNLLNHKTLCKDIVKFNQDGKLVAAICAAPMVLGKLGILKDKKACCYPGYEKYLEGAIIKEEETVVDKNIITSRGAGTAIPFALALIEYLQNKPMAKKVKDSIVF